MSHLTLSRQRTIDGPGGFDRNTRSIPRLEVQQSGNDSVMMLPPNAQSSSEKCSRLLKLTTDVAKFRTETSNFGVRWICPLWHRL